MFDVTGGFLAGLLGSEIPSAEISVLRTLPRPYVLLCIRLGRGTALDLDLWLALALVTLAPSSSSSRVLPS